MEPQLTPGAAANLAHTALEALKSGMTHQLITNKVITASRVNTNKQKRRAA